MSAGTLVALATAVVGVLGTLLSAVLTQRASNRTKRHELEHADRRRVDDLVIQERRGRMELQRSCYMALNKIARQHLMAITDHLHVIFREEDRHESRRQLDEARAVHRDCYAEAQLIVPDAVLEAARNVNKELGATYGMIKRLDNGNPRSEDSLDTVQHRIDTLWELLRGLRHQMRVSLGVAEDE